MYLQNLATYAESVISTDSKKESVGRPSFSHIMRASAFSVDLVVTHGSSLSPELSRHTKIQDVDRVLVSIVDKMGFPEAPSGLPKSFQLALQNRFTREELEGSQRAANSVRQVALPLFFAGAFMLPATVAAVTGIDLPSAIKRMIPAVLKSYRRHAVDSHSWPALYPSANNTYEVLGMMLFATNHLQRQRLHQFQAGLLERSRAVDVLAKDGLRVSHEALIYVWNMPSSMLEPIEQKAWSLSDMLRSEWLHGSHAKVAAEEAGLFDLGSDELLAERKSADILTN